jgi:hypothetical protein
MGNCIIFLGFSHFKNLIINSKKFLQKCHVLQLFVVLRHRSAQPSSKMRGGKRAVPETATDGDLAIPKKSAGLNFQAMYEKQVKEIRELQKKLCMESCRLYQTCIEYEYE